MNPLPRRCLFCGQENEAFLAKCPKCHKPLQKPGIIEKMEEAMTGALQRELEHRYEIVEKIGHSGTSLIYKAKQKGVQRPVTLKVPRWLFPIDNRLPKTLALRFREEAQQLSNLHHRGIVRLLEWDVIDEQMPFLVLQYLEGEDLRYILQKSAEPLAIEKVRHWFLTLAEALHFAHQKGVIHCDIKSANIIISPEGQPTLIDFSIARDKDIRKLANITHHAGVPGTWLYMSPEQARYERVDERSDIYSFGVVLYEALAGRLPFEGDCWEDIRVKTLCEAPPAPRQFRPDIPATLENVVLRCLMKAPEERYQNCAELISAIKNGEPKAPRFTAPRLTPMPSTRWQSPSAQGAKIFVLALIALVVCGVLLWTFFQSNKTTEPARSSLPQEQKSDSLPPQQPVSPPPVVQVPLTPDHSAQQKKWLEDAVQKFGAQDFEMAWQLCAKILQFTPNDPIALSLQQQIREKWHERKARLLAASRYNEALSLAALFKKYISAAEGAKVDSEIYEHWGDHWHARKAYAAAQKKYQQGSHADPGNSTLATKERQTEQSIAAWLGITLVFIPGDTFRMGDIWGESKALGKEHGDELPAHLVRVNSFYMSAHEITFAQYGAFCSATGRALPFDNDWGQGERPVLNVSWEDANQFCAWLAERVGKNVRISLPSEAEWEFAAREGGKSRRYSGIDEAALLADYAWWNVATTQPVGGKRPNALGLFDMSGNAYEWCWDRYDDDYYKKSPTDNPRGPNDGKEYVVRGGSIFSPHAELRTSARARTRSPYKLDKWKHPTGFRIVVKD